MWLMATYLDGTEISSRNQTTEPFQPPCKGIPNPERLPSTPLRTPVTCSRGMASLLRVDAAGKLGYREDWRTFLAELEPSWMEVSLGCL